MFPTIYMNNGGGNVVYEYYTSNTYAIVFSDYITSNATFGGGTFFELSVENVSSNTLIVSGELRNQLQTYTYYPVENVSTSNVEIVSGNVRTLLIGYSNAAVENVTTSNVEIVSGNLVTLLISYSNYPEENVTSNVVIVSGSLA